MSQTTIQPPTPAPVQPPGLFQWVRSRLSEASTWGGISAFAAAMVTQVPASVQPYMLGLSGAAAALAVVIAEKGSSRTPAQIAADALAAAQEADRLRS